MNGSELQVPASGEKMFPVLQGAGRRNEERCFVPWKLVAAHTKQCSVNHSQSVERLAERGGLCASELAAVLEDRPWRSMADAEAWSAVFNAAVTQLAPVEPAPKAPDTRPCMFRIGLTTCGYTENECMHEGSSEPVVPPNGRHKYTPEGE